MAGQRFAMMELKVVLANYLRHFRFSLSDPSRRCNLSTIFYLNPRMEFILLLPSGRFRTYQRQDEHVICYWIFLKYICNSSDSCGITEAYMGKAENL